jgi:hypothetical protein
MFSQILHRILKMSLNSERTLPFFFLLHIVCPSVTNFYPPPTIPAYKKRSFFILVHSVKILFLFAPLFFLSAASATSTLYVFLIPKMVHISLFSIWHFSLLMYFTTNVQRMPSTLLECCDSYPPPPPTHTHTLPTILYTGHSIR